MAEYVPGTIYSVEDANKVFKSFLYFRRNIKVQIEETSFHLKKLKRRKERKQIKSIWKLFIYKGNLSKIISEINDLELELMRLVKLSESSLEIEAIGYSEDVFISLTDSFDRLMQSPSYIWLLQSRENVINVGMNVLLTEREEVYPIKKKIPFLFPKQEGLSFKINNEQHLVLFKDCFIIYNSDSNIQFFDYSVLSTSSNFNYLTEDLSFENPQGQYIRNGWLYANKDGSRNKRRKYNEEVQFYKYNILRFENPQGKFTLEYVFSDLKLSDYFGLELKIFLESLKESRQLFLERKNQLHNTTFERFINQLNEYKLKLSRWNSDILNLNNTESFLKYEKDIDGLRFRNITLVLNCYSNKYNIDLLTAHLERSRFEDNRLSVYDDKFRNREIFFHDGISTSFELIQVNGLNYLLGDKSCYPCSYVIDQASKMYFVGVLLVPNGNEINCTGSVKESSVIFHDTQALHEEFVDLNEYKNFLIDYKLTFRKNDWFNRSLLRFNIINHKQFDFRSRFKLLRKKHLLNPFELTISSIYLGFNLDIKDFVDCVYNDTSIGVWVPGLSKAVLPRKYNFSKSTQKMFSRNDFREIALLVKQEEINELFEIDFLTETITFEKFKANSLEHLLGVSTEYLSHVQRNEIFKLKLLELNITDELVELYYGKLQTNILNYENELRLTYGYDVVGTHFMERLLLYKLIQDFPELIFESQGKPDWLGELRFDIYIPKYNIAIEYNGEQHYKSIDFFGGEEGFRDYIRRDQKKAEMSKQNGCLLLIIRYDEDFQKAYEKVNLIINDMVET